MNLTTAPDDTTDGTDGGGGTVPSVGLQTIAFTYTAPNDVELEVCKESNVSSAAVHVTRTAWRVPNTNGINSAVAGSGQMKRAKQG